MALESEIQPTGEISYVYGWPEEAFQNKGEYRWQTKKGDQLWTRNVGEKRIEFLKLEFQIKGEKFWDLSNINCTNLIFDTVILEKVNNCVIGLGDSLKVGFPKDLSLD